MQVFSHPYDQDEYFFYTPFRFLYLGAVDFNPLKEVCLKFESLIEYFFLSLENCSPPTSHLTPSLSSPPVLPPPPPVCSFCGFEPVISGCVVVLFLLQPWLLMPER